MTVVSQISPHLLLDEQLSADALAGSMLCGAAMKTLTYIRDIGGIGLTKNGTFQSECFGGTRRIVAIKMIAGFKGKARMSDLEEPRLPQTSAEKHKRTVASKSDDPSG